MGKFTMKTNSKKMMSRIGYVVIATALLMACASTTLEQQIAVKEPGSWDFKYVGTDRVDTYIRIYDSPGKVGWFKYEYGQKHPCNQGFQKVIKTTTPGLVAYEHDHDAKSFACDMKIRYLFRTDTNGHPYEGWVDSRKRHEKTPFVDLTKAVNYMDKTNQKPSFTLVK